EFFLCVVAVLPGRSLAQAVLPSARLMHTSVRLSSVEVCRKIFPFEMMGEDHPLPGTGTFQRRFLVPLSSTGTSVAARPMPFGPRKRGQSVVPVSGAAVSARASGRPTSQLVMTRSGRRETGGFGLEIIADGSGFGKSKKPSRV